MIVRTYGRRSRGTGRAFSETSNDAVFDDDDDPFAFKEDEQQSQPSSSSYYNNNNNNNRNSSFSQETLEFQETPQEGFNYTFSSQDSTRFFNSSGNDSNSESPAASLQLLKPRRREKARKLNDGRREKARKLNDGRREREEEALFFEAAPTPATLMETQECGEMMECVDEVEFALDGLRKKGQGGVRVRRACLLALLNVCGSAQQRRLLKAQGMAKTIIDVILDISLDDSPSNLAAAALFYILANDTQDSYLIDSARCVRFLLKLLKPVVPETTAHKMPSISQKLCALRKDMLVPQDFGKKIDSSSNSIVHKVLETLASCKDLKASKTNVDKDDMSRPELNPDWVSLLTIEKACLSTISIEETTGTVRKAGGNFKDKLRELGGLDAVFELAVKFHSTLEVLIEHVAPSSRVSNDDKLQCLPLLLKCLKIMENATFLSKENQSHLLRLKGTSVGLGSSLSFVKLMVNLIKILSELSLRKISSAASSPEVPSIHSNGADNGPALHLNSEHKADGNEFSARFSQECPSLGRNSSETGLSTSQSSQRSSASESRSLPQGSGATARSWLGNCLVELSSSNGSGSRSLSLRNSDGNGHGSQTNTCYGRGSFDNDNSEDMVIDLEDSQDPFAFDEGDYAPSKWDKLPGGRKGQRKQKRRPPISDVDDMSLSHLTLSQEDFSSQPMLSQDDFSSQQEMLSRDGYHNDQQNGISHLSSDTSCTTSIDEENCNLVADCLLTAIKVLMNLTNDNSLGCQQIAVCGGLETLSFLIARHFPSFSDSSSDERKKNMLLNNTAGLKNQKDVHLNEQELDFLVTILGLLVNLVENDGDNRSRLAAAKISLPCSGELSEIQTGMIPLLCSIFLANRGSGEAAEEELQSLDDDEVVLQGEKEAEKMIVEAYAALLLAFLSTESKSTRNVISSYLPDRNLKALVPVLDRFVTFHMTLNMISPETHKTVSEVIESCRIP